jgi:crotonyl-CoA carboxylase/reductase
MVNTKDAYEVGQIPPLGEVPPYMYAQLIRPERFGEPIQAFQIEKVETPAELRPREALVLVMAAGINYNNVWAARGVPVNVIKAREREGDMTGFHIGGSDASGIVYKVGSAVTNIKVGDQVVIHCGMWDEDTNFVQAGNDPMFDPSFRIWGYESNWGSFAQFTKVQAHQCLPKAPHLTWEEAAAPTLVGATAYRMLRAWPPHTVEKGDVVLVWGGSGGLGSMAIQIAREFGAIPVAVVSSEDKFDFCTELGAKGCINRKEFDHWGMLPHWTDTEAFGKWSQGARAFGAKFWEVLGERRSPRIVFEHPGEDTIPTSIFMCDTGGMVVICAGTSGFNASVDLRYLWMRQKRLQGSHFANDEQAGAFNQLVIDGKIDPCLGETYSFEDIGKCHQLMYEGNQPLGVMAALVSAKRTGMREVE